MNEAVWFLLAAIGASAIGGAVVAFRHRSPSPAKRSSVDDFSARMSALAPEDDER